MRASIVVIFLTSLGSFGCSFAGVDLDSKQCPCSDGWTCNTRTNLCVENGELLADGGGPTFPDAQAPFDGGVLDADDPFDPKDACPPGTVRAPGNICQEVCEEASDRDDDGTFDCEDLCPDDVDKVEPGRCGCGNPEVPDCFELDGGTDAGDDGGGVALLCDPDDASCLDPDGDGISDDGDGSGVKGDAPCRDGIREGCDDNCSLVANPWQDDGDNDGVGDRCDTHFCRASDKLVAVGHGDQVHLSLNQGESWSTRRPGAQAELSRSPNWEDVVHARGTWIANNGHGIGSTWARSADGDTWTVHTFSHWNDVTSAQGIGYADGVWFLGSEDGRLAVSHDDGRSFGSIGEPNGWAGTAIESFAYHAGRLVAVGDGGQISYSDTPEIVSSWETLVAGSGDFKHVLVVKGLWVAAGKGTCFYSEDGAETWTSCGAPDETYYGLHYSDGYWMLGDISSGAWISRGRPNDFSERVFASTGGAWPVYGDCGSGRWFAGHVLEGDHGLRSSEDEGRDSELPRVIAGEERHLYGITGD